MAFPGGLGLSTLGGLVVFGLSLGPVTLTKQYGVALQHAQYNMKYAGIKEYEKTTMRIMEIR